MKFQRANIWPDVNSLGEHLRREWLTDYSLRVVMTSGGFDPLHAGHLACIQEAALLGGLLVVIVNSDDFLRRKKGYVFMGVRERQAIVAGIAGVDHVVEYDDGTQLVAGAIDILCPNVFAKGGDRSDPSTIAAAEHDACRKRDVVIAYGVGGYRKIQSSSLLLEPFKSPDFSRPQAGV